MRERVHHHHHQNQTTKPTSLSNKHHHQTSSSSRFVGRCRPGRITSGSFLPMLRVGRFLWKGRWQVFVEGPSNEIPVRYKIRPTLNIHTPRSLSLRRYDTNSIFSYKPSSRSQTIVLSHHTNQRSLPSSSSAPLPSSLPLTPSTA